MKRTAAFEDTRTNDLAGFNLAGSAQSSIRNSPIANRHFRRTDLPRRSHGQQKHGLRVPKGIRNRNRNLPGN
jgi:hypothetical protein